MDKQLQGISKAKVRSKARFDMALTLKELAVWKGVGYSIVRAWQAQGLPMLSGYVFPSVFQLWIDQNGIDIHCKETVRRAAAQRARTYRGKYPHVRIKQNLSSRLRGFIKSAKSESISSLIGCTASELKTWLESQFRNGMTWGNYGRFWHVDHRRPCACFDLFDAAQQRECFHFSNLQPLLALENLRKGARV